jgi:2-polyprenyl-6-hydroxyphenyl methylase/3-demethylubiquinone-9 3-methyltransferase
MRETARVLRPGSLYLFDTVNRTFASKLLGIKVMQEWRWTRISDVPLHAWDMFVRPAELAELLTAYGLQMVETVGLAPRANPAALLRGFYQARRGKINYGELSRRLNFGQVEQTSVSYMGYAFKL